VFFWLQQTRNNEKRLHQRSEAEYSLRLLLVLFGACFGRPSWKRYKKTKKKSRSKKLGPKRMRGTRQIVGIAFENGARIAVPLPSP